MTRALYLPKDIDQILKALEQKEGMQISREVRIKDSTFSEDIYVAREFQTIRIYASDITERKRAEMALRDSEERYRALFDNANDALYFHDEKGRLLDVNTVACQRLGYSREELLKMSLKDIDGPDATALIPQHIQEIRQQGHAVFESNQVRRDGSSFPVEVSARAITYKGEPAVLGIVRDITDRRKMEEAVRESEARYRTYYDLGLVGMVIETPEGGWIAANDRFCEMLGYSREELFKKHWTELTHPDDLAKDEDTLYPQLLRGEIENYSIEKRFVRKNGEPIDVIITVGCTRNAHGKADQVFGIVVDITERKRIDEKLRKSQETFRRLASIVESSNDAIISRTPDGLVTSWNKTAEEMFGYAANEVIGKPFFLNYPAGYEAPKRTLEKSQSGRTGRTLRDQTPKKRWVTNRYLSNPLHSQRQKRQNCWTVVNISRHHRPQEGRGSAATQRTTAPFNQPKCR